MYSISRPSGRKFPLRTQSSTVVIGFVTIDDGDEPNSIPLRNGADISSPNPGNRRTDIACTNPDAAPKAQHAAERDRDFACAPAKPTVLATLPARSSPFRTTSSAKGAAFAAPLRWTRRSKDMRDTVHTESGVFERATEPVS